MGAAGIGDWLAPPRYDQKHLHQPFLAKHNTHNTSQPKSTRKQTHAPLLTHSFLTHRLQPMLTGNTNTRAKHGLDLDDYATHTHTHIAIGVYGREIWENNWGGGVTTLSTTGQAHLGNTGQAGRGTDGKIPIPSGMGVKPFLLPHYFFFSLLISTLFCNVDYLVGGLSLFCNIGGSLERWAGLRLALFYTTFDLASTTTTTKQPWGVWLIRGRRLGKGRTSALGSCALHIQSCVYYIS